MGAGGVTPNAAPWTASCGEWVALSPQIVRRKQASIAALKAAIEADDIHQR